MTKSRAQPWLVSLAPLPYRPAAPADPATWRPVRNLCFPATPSPIRSVTARSHDGLEEQEGDPRAAGVPLAPPSHPQLSYVGVGGGRLRAAAAAGRRGAEHVVSALGGAVRRGGRAARRQAAEVQVVLRTHDRSVSRGRHESDQRGVT